MKYSSLLHVVKQALARSGYVDDAAELLGVQLLSLSQTAPAQLVVLGHFQSCNGRVYLDMQPDGTWGADY